MAKIAEFCKIGSYNKYTKKTFDCIFQSVYAVSNCVDISRIARNHSKKYHLCQKPYRSASARIWIFVLTSPSSGLFWKLWLSPIRIRGGWGQRWMTVTKSMMMMIMMILSACFLSAKSRVFEHLLSLFKTISNSGNSFCYLQSPLNCAAWLIKQHHCNAWPENQPWKLKYKLKTDLTHVLSMISPSRWQKISKCTWFSMVERSPTAATCAATQPPVLPNWKDTCSGSQRPILLGCEISWSTK